MPKSIVVWRFTEGKPGHMKQTLGLVQGLRALTPLLVHEITVGAENNTPLAQQIAAYAAPDLLIGAGHATHVPMLWCRIRFGGKTVVLLKPTLPVSWFDMVLLPLHDRCYGFGNVVRTEISLCPIVSGLEKDQNFGVILIGGESRHYALNEAQVSRDIKNIVREKKQIRWEIFDSRRTPTDFLDRLRLEDHVKLRHRASIPQDYLSNALARASAGWVTGDSISMVHEAIGNRLSVGVIEMPPKQPTKPNKILLALDSMVSARLLVRYPSDVFSKFGQRQIGEDYNLKFAKLVHARFL